MNPIMHMGTPERRSGYPKLPMTRPWAAAIWETLVQNYLIPPDPLNREWFVDYVCRDHGDLPIEWRTYVAMGVKFRMAANGRVWRMDCYPEEDKEPLSSRIVAANQSLALLEYARTTVRHMEPNVRKEQAGEEAEE